MMQVNVHEAKTHLSRLLTKVESGEEVTIAKAGKPVARLVPVDRNVVKRVPGTAKGEIIIADHFDDPLPDDLFRAFES
jgi:prevent-host-death family protein